MRKITLIFTLIIVFYSCKKSDDQVNTTTDLETEIIQDYSHKVCKKSYQMLAEATNALDVKIETLINNPNQQNLIECQNQWKEARRIWEKTESWLFGPVSTDDIDPKIDTWPVDFNRLDSIINGTVDITPNFIESSEFALKGFHPIEYLIFGKGGNRIASQLKPRELVFLKELSSNLKNQTNLLYLSWSENGGNYIEQLLKAGSSTMFPTKLSLYEEKVNAMIGICDEVANEKMGEVLTQLDSNLEESPFSKNSLVDFTNNINGVKSAYMCNFENEDGKGLEDFVKKHNLSLNNRIQQKIEVAIASLQNITVPFGLAIYTQPIQVQNAIDAINNLKDELETGLLPLVQLHIK